MQKGLIVHTVVSNDRGEVLILLRSEKSSVLPSHWDIPGGTLEDAEDPAMGAIREIKEETGLVVSKVKLFFQKSNIDAMKNKQFVTLIFHGKAPAEDVVVNLREHSKFAWIDPSKIGDYKTVGYLPDCLRAYTELTTNPMN